MTKASHFERALTMAVRCFAGAALLLIALQSAFNLVALLDSNEHVYFLSATPLLSALACALSLFAAMLAVRKRERLCAFAKRHSPEIVILCLYAALLTAWVLLTQAMPVSDSKYVLLAANDLRSGNVTMFEEGAYMATHPNQKGIALLFYALCGLFGGINVVGMQLLNAAALVWAAHLTYRCTERATHSRAVSLAVLIAACLFYPLLCYTSFVYGTIFGLTLAVASIDRMLAFAQSGRFRDALLCAVCVGLACVVKSNYQVFAIAVGLCLLADACTKRSWRRGLSAVLLAVVCALTSFGAQTALSALTAGESERHEGIPYLAYVEMGLQDGDRGPGWFNDYVQKVHRDVGYDSAAASAQVKADLAETLAALQADPQAAWRFFARKTTSQWCDPTFQGLWLVQVRPSQLDAPSELYWQLVSNFSKLHLGLMGLGRMLLAFVYVGALLCVLLCGKRLNAMNAVGLIAFAGGFAFHLIWEAKGQYALPYAAMLIPYAVVGWLALAKRLTACAALLRHGRRPRLSRARMLSLTVVLIASLALLLTPLRSVLIDCADADDTLQYEQLAGDARR